MHSHYTDRGEGNLPDPPIGEQLRATDDEIAQKLAAAETALANWREGGSTLAGLCVEEAKDAAILALALSRLIGQHEAIRRRLPDTEGLMMSLKFDMHNHACAARLALAAAGFGAEIEGTR